MCAFAEERGLVDERAGGSCSLDSGGGARLGETILQISQLSRW